MALDRFNVSLPVAFTGLEDLAPEETQVFTLELINRLESNSTALINALRDQVIVDPNALAALNRGEQTPATTTIATIDDVEGTQLETMLWSF